jgi:hypothetical protein
VFQQAWQQLDQQRRCIQQLYHCKHSPIDEAAIAYQLQLAESEVNNQLLTSTQELVTAIKNWTQNRLNVCPDILNPLADKIAILIHTLIVNYCVPELKSTEN